jgi:hypothetical protein
MVMPLHFPFTPQRTPAAIAAMYALEKSATPTRWHIMGDSTGNETDEWGYLTAVALAAAFPGHTHNYRSWNDTDQQYDAPTVLATGTAGLRHIDTGLEATSMRLEIDDDAATSIAGDIDVRLKIDFHGNALTVSSDLCGKFATAPNRSWRLMSGLVSGKLTFGWSADGTTEISKNSTVVVPAAVYNNGPVWIRATLDVDNGAVGNDVKFYYGTDNENWTQIGATVTTAATTSIADTTAKTQFIGRGAGALQQQPVAFSFYELEVYGSLDGTSRIVDIDVGALPMRIDGGATTSTFYDDMGNLVTATHHDNSTIVGAPRFALFNGSHPGSALSYHYDGTRYPKLICGSADAVFVSHSHNHGGNVTTFIALYKTLTDLLIASNPYMYIAANLQNPRFSPAVDVEEHALRMAQLGQFAVSQGFGVIDAFSAMDSSLIDTDGIHPLPAGGAVWSSRVRAVMLGT